MGIFSAFFIFSMLDSAFLGLFKGGPIFLEPAEPEPSEPDFETEPLEPEPDDFETVRNRTEPELPEILASQGRGGGEGITLVILGGGCLWTCGCGRNELHQSV